MAYEFGPETEPKYRLDEDGLYRNDVKVHVPGKALKVLRKIVQRNRLYSNQELADAAGFHGKKNAQFVRDRVKELRKALQSKEAILNERDLGYILGWPVTKDDLPASRPYLVRRSEPLTRTCRIQFGKDGLHWRLVEIEGPVITGGQIIEAARLRPNPDEWIIVRWTAGAFMEVRRKEKIRLSDNTHERFIAFRVDRIYRFFLNNRPSIWGSHTIDCRVLKELASTQSPADVIWLEASDGKTRQLVEDQFVDLEGPEIERFFSDTQSEG